MTTEEKWKASIACDASYDGRFFYGVKTTGIFCRPSCKSKSPKKGNVVFFDSMEEARKSGLRPCKRCRPDLLEFQPQKEEAEKIKELYLKYFADAEMLKQEMQKLCVGRNRMIRLFHNFYGKTPSEYLNELRIDHAKKLLLDSESTILHIALESGFKSQSSFYIQFHKLTGLSPGEFREQKDGTTNL